MLLPPQPFIDTTVTVLKRHDPTSDQPNDTGTTAEKPYQLDYRFDLPARFSFGVSDEKGERNSLENEGAVIHEGMRLLTSSDGRYQVRRLLGEGGKKRVYLATDTRLDRDVAIALIKTEGLDAASLALS